MRAHVRPKLLKHLSRFKLGNDEIKVLKKYLLLKA